MLGWQDIWINFVQWKFIVLEDIGKLPSQPMEGEFVQVYEKQLAHYRKWFFDGLACSIDVMAFREWARRKVDYGDL